MHSMDSTNYVLALITLLIRACTLDRAPLAKFQMRGLFQISGGNFTENEADLGGFLSKAGRGITSCKGASVVRHKGVDGGAIYAIDGATLEWECDLKHSSALVGPAM